MGPWFWRNRESLTFTFWLGIRFRVCTHLCCRFMFKFLTWWVYLGNVSQFGVTFHHPGRVLVSESLVCAERLSSSRAFKRIYERYTSAHTISKCIFGPGNGVEWSYSRAGMSNVVRCLPSLSPLLFAVLSHVSQFCVSVCFAFSPIMVLN